MNFGTGPALSAGAGLQYIAGAVDPSTGQPLLTERMVAFEQKHGFGSLFESLATTPTARLPKVWGVDRRSIFGPLKAPRRTWLQRLQYLCGMNVEIILYERPELREMVLPFSSRFSLPQPLRSLTQIRAMGDLELAREILPEPWMVERVAHLLFLRDETRRRKTVFRFFADERVYGLSPPNEGQLSNEDAAALSDARFVQYAFPTNTYLQECVSAGGGSRIMMGSPAYASPMPDMMNPYQYMTAYGSPYASY